MSFRRFWALALLPLFGIVYFVNPMYCKRFFLLYQIDCLEITVLLRYLYPVIPNFKDARFVSLQEEKVIMPGIWYYS